MNILNIPKAITHEHIEACLDINLARKLADQYQRPIPEKFMDEKKTRFVFRDFFEFLEIYDCLAANIRTADDYYLVASDYFRRAAGQNAVYAELLISPFHMAGGEDINGSFHGFDKHRYRDILAALAQASEDSEAQHNLVAYYQAAGIRNLGPEIFHQTAELVLEEYHPAINSWGIAGNELHGNLSDYAKTYQLFSQFRDAQAPSSGFYPQKRAHVCEHQPPSEVSKALQDLDVDIIDHGVNTIGSAAMMDQLIERQTLLTLCLTSNKELIYQGDMTKSPIRKFYDKGMRISLGPDDSTILNTDIQKEYEIAHKVFGFSTAELFDITLMGVNGSHMHDSKRTKINKKIFNMMPDSIKIDFAKKAQEADNETIKQRFAKWQDLSEQNTARNQNKNTHLHFNIS